MLSIIKEEPNDKLTEFLASIGFLSDLNNKIVMVAKDAETYLGAGTLELVGGKVYLNFVKTKENDFVLDLSIVKSLLNLADLRGIKTVYGNNTSLEKLYKTTRFKLDDSEYSVDLEGYFTSGC